MTDDQEHLAVEIAQFLQHVHDIADLLAERMKRLPQAEAESLLDQELVSLAVRAKQLEATRQAGDRVERWIQSYRRDPNASRRAAKTTLTPWRLTSFVVARWAD